MGVNDTITHFDSLQFGTRMFYDLQSFINTNNDSLYYNTTFGIISIKQNAQRFYLYRFNQK